MPIYKTLLKRIALLSALLFAAGSLTGCATPMAQAVASMLKSEDSQPAPKKSKKSKKPADLMADE